MDALWAVLTSSTAWNTIFTTLYVCLIDCYIYNVLTCNISSLYLPVQTHDGNDLEEAYNLCLDAIKDFRTEHIKLATRYTLIYDKYILYVCNWEEVEWVGSLSCHLIKGACVTWKFWKIDLDLTCR